jgi:uncharacterized membrane protein (UPF0136 family)
VNPEHLHVILNHLPLGGFLAALIPLAYGLIKKEEAALVCGLLVGAVFGSTASLVYWTGSEAEARFEQQLVTPNLDAVSETALVKHAKRGTAASLAVALATLLCIGGLVVAKKRKGWLRVASGVCIGALVISAGLMGLAANTGGQIRHPEFRPALLTPGG